MKVYVSKTGVTVTGQAWQVLAILKQYKKRYKTVEEWVASVHKQTKAIHAAVKTKIQ